MLTIYLTSCKVAKSLSKVVVQFILLLAIYEVPAAQ